MKTSFLPAAWRKTLMLASMQPTAPVRSRRGLRLDQLLQGERGAHGMRHDLADDTAAPFDGSWHESSRALARGLVVREWGHAGPVGERAAPR